MSLLSLRCRLTPHAKCQRMPFWRSVAVALGHGKYWGSLAKPVHDFKGTVKTTLTTNDIFKEPSCRMVVHQILSSSPNIRPDQGITATRQASRTPLLFLFLFLTLPFPRATTTHPVALVPARDHFRSPHPPSSTSARLALHKYEHLPFPIGPPSRACIRYLRNVRSTGTQSIRHPHLPARTGTPLPHKAEKGVKP